MRISTKRAGVQLAKAFSVLSIEKEVELERTTLTTALLVYERSENVQPVIVRLAPLLISTKGALKVIALEPPLATLMEVRVTVPRAAWTKLQALSIVKDILVRLREEVGVSVEVGMVNIMLDSSMELIFFE